MASLVHYFGLGPRASAEWLQWPERAPPEAPAAPRQIVLPTCNYLTCFLPPHSLPHRRGLELLVGFVDSLRLPSGVIL
jgi:hypothetical protein